MTNELQKIIFIYKVEENSRESNVHQYPLSLKYKLTLSNNVPCASRNSFSSEILPSQNDILKIFIGWPHEDNVLICLEKLFPYLNLLEIVLRKY